MGFQLYLGFLAEEKTPWGVVKYLFWMGGIFFLGLLGLVVFLRRKGRVLAVSFLIPTIFAFTILMTVDINVNHKYIMISYAFLGILWAWAVCSLWRGKDHKEDPGGGSGCMPDSDWCLRLRGNIERQRLRTQDRHQYEQRTYRMAG